MRLPRTVLGLVVAAGAAPAVAQPPAVWPAPTGPNRLVFPVPPWVTHGPRPVAGPNAPAAPAPAALPALPAGASPAVSEVRFVAPGSPALVAPAADVRPAPSVVVPAASVAPAPVVNPLPAARPAAAPQTRPTAAPAARPDVWGPGSVRQFPGTTVPTPAPARR